MKTLGRALLILAVFALVMGITYAVVIAGTAGSNTPQFQRGEGGFPRPGLEQPNFANGEGPEFPGGERNESHGERGSGNLLFGMIKNTFVVAIVVVLIVVPKGWIQKRRRTEQAAS